jgi:hypothetical protein
MKKYGVSQQFDGEQPDTMSDAVFEHFNLVRMYPRYWETRCWYPVLISHDQDEHGDVVDWMAQRKLKRGDSESRNDWLHPTGGLFLFREEAHAIEFMLRWGK